MKTIITLDDEKFGGQYYNAAHIEQIDERGIHSAKHISISDLLSALNGTTVEDGNQYYRLGKLPHYYFDGILKYTEDNQICAKIALAIPKRQANMIFENAQYRICFPALFFCYVIKKGDIKQTKVFALKGKNWNYDSTLYNYPFGNVSISTHDVCWGSNALPRILGLQTLDVVSSLFYDSPTNNDYYDVSKSTKWNCNNLREVLERLKTKDQFPDKILVRSNLGTIGTFIEQFFR